MADYNAIRKTIDANIYANGEQKITGEILNDVLNEMVDAQEEFNGEIDNLVENYPNITINGDVTNAPDEEDITSDANNRLKFANRPATNGMGYVILRKNKTFAEQVTLADTIYEIRYEFDLGGESVTIPEGCVLKFDGGRLSNGTIVGQGTAIKGRKCLYCNLSGNFANATIEIDWFATAGDDISDALDVIISYANAVNDHLNIVFPANDSAFYMSRALANITCNHIYFYGNGTRLMLPNPESGSAIFPFVASSIKNGVFFDQFRFQCAEPNENCSVFLFSNFASIRFRDCSFTNIGQGIVMGTTTAPAYSLNLNGSSATLANIGKAFVTLVNGAGFTWNTHSSISHMEAAVPSEGQTMNTEVGTNAVDIIGNWDSVDLDIFAEKLYRGVNIVPASGAVLRGAIYYVKIHDCIFDYIRDCAIYVDQQYDITNNYLNIQNNYIYTWEGRGMSFVANASHINDVRIVNNMVYRAGTSAIYASSTNVTFDTWLISNNYFAKDCYISGLLKSVIDDNRINGTITFAALGRCEFSRNKATTFSFGANTSVIYNDNVTLGSSAWTFRDRAKPIGVGTSYPSNPSQGEQYYNTTYQKMAAYNGTRWQDAQGQAMANRRGSTAQRPTTGLTEYDYGFLYYNTEVQKYNVLNTIVNGTYNWHRIQSYPADWKTYGTTAERPTPTIAWIGYVYFDTTLGKMIVWNGTAWVNMDGTALA